MRSLLFPTSTLNGDIDRSSYILFITDIVRNVAQSCSIMCTKDTKRIGGIIQNDASPGWIIKAEGSAAAAMHSVAVSRVAVSS